MKHFLTVVVIAGLRCRKESALLLDYGCLPSRVNGGLSVLRESGQLRAIKTNSDLLSPSWATADLAKCHKDSAPQHGRQTLRNNRERLL